MASFAVRFSRPALGAAYRPLTFEIAQRSVTAVASPFILKEHNSSSTLDLPQTSYAKPFDQVPGHRVLPIIGTAWGMFPRVGKK